MPTTCATSNPASQPAALAEPLLLREREVARLIGVHTVTLRVWRREGRGPTWLRLGRRIVVYPLDALREWIDAQRRTAR